MVRSKQSVVTGVKSRPWPAPLPGREQETGAARWTDAAAQSDGAGEIPRRHEVIATGAVSSTPAVRSAVTVVDVEFVGGAEEFPVKVPVVWVWCQSIHGSAIEPGGNIVH